MNPFRIPRTTRIHEPARPVLLESGSTAVFLIHGYTGNVSEMMYLAGNLHSAGFTVSIPRLPGHGTRLEDFFQTSWEQWLRFCLDHYLDLDARYEKVFVAGLSMGAVLALLVAEVFRPGKLALLAPAVLVRNPLIHLSPFLSRFIRRIDREYEPDPDEDYQLRAIHDEYWTHEYPRQVAQLYRLQRIARRGLSRVEADTLVILSEMDGTVPIKAGMILKKGLVSARTKTVVLRESGHVITNGIEKETVANEVTGWFLERPLPSPDEKISGRSDELPDGTGIAGT